MNEPATLDRIVTSRPLITLLSGTAIAQLIPLVASPAIARLYDPSDYGTLALFVSLSAVGAVVATGRYEFAILSPREEDKAFQIVLLAGVVSVVTCVIGFLAVGTGCLLVHCEHFGPNGGILWLIPVSSLGVAWLSTLTLWMNRRAQYRRLALNRAIQSMLAAVLMILFGLASTGALGLVVASLIGQWSAVLLMGRLVFKGAVDRPREFDVPSLVQAARRFSAFPTLNLPHALLDNVQIAASMVLLNIAFGGGVIGLYAFMQRIMRAPLMIVGSSMGLVIQQRLAEALHAGAPLQPLVVAQMRSALRWVVPFVALAALAPQIFAVVFGESWREAGVYGLLLTPWIAASFIVSPLSQLPLLLGRQRQALGFGLAYQASLLVPCIMAVARPIDVHVTFALQSLISCFVLFTYGRWLLRISHSERRGE